MREKGSIAPLLDALLDYSSQKPLRLHMPGHKGRCLEDMASISHKIFEFDVTEVPGLDDLHEPSGVIKEAQILLSQAYGADESFFLVNGTTGGLHAALMATCKPGDKVILPRNVHRSVIGGVILSGTDPVYLRPEVSRFLGATAIISSEELKQALALTPDARCLIVVNPDYWGIAGDIGLLVNLAHMAHVPVIADEAHGPHLLFHSDLPLSAIQAGADITVQSAHKLLGSLTQSSFLHLKKGIVCRERLCSALKLLQSTSPSYPLMASLDVVRMRMAMNGKELLGAVLDLCRELRSTINETEGFCCFDEDDLDIEENFTIDPTKLVISGRELGISGYELARILRDDHGIQVELADLNNILIMITIADIDKEEIKRLIKALQHISLKRGKSLKRGINSISLNLPDLPEKVLNPRDAFFSSQRLMELKEARGKICGEIIAPYPPGIPLLCPGELITDEIIEYLNFIRDAGAKIHGLKENHLVSVIK